MNEFYKMDVFFFISSIAVVLIGILLIVAIVYIIKILNDVKYISKKAKTETDLLADDLRELRQNVKTEGTKFKHFGKFISKLYKRHKS